MRKTFVSLFPVIFSLTSAVGISSTHYEIPPPSTSFRTDADTNLLKQISKAKEKLTEAATKGLVFITVTKLVSSPNMIDPFEYFFGRDPNAPQAPRPQQRQEGFGSGFFVDLDKGYILTNNHVVENADKIVLKLSNGSSYDGKIIGHDRDSDVAVVQVLDKNFSRANLAALVLDNSESVVVGQDVIALGAPFLLEASASFGNVSAVGRGNLQLTKIGNFIQTDAAINPGNSGGPLLNMDGKVIGINSAIFSQSGSNAGIGFSIPSNIARRIASALINKGSYNKGFVGITYEPVSKKVLTSLKLPEDTKGIIIADVSNGGPADEAGVQAWDVVVAVDGRSFEPLDLPSIIGLKDPGSSLKFTLYRQGKKMDLDVKVASAPTDKSMSVASKAQTPQQTPAKKNGVYERFGFALEPINDKLRDQYGLNLKKGLVVVYVETMSPAWRQGIREGDVITGLNGKTISDIANFEKDTKGASEVLIQLNRKGRSVFVPLEGVKK